jgi:hypothetical protein
MNAAQNRFKQVKPCRPHCCETQQLFVPSKPAQADLEPRHAAPSVGCVVALAASVGAL